MTQSNFGGAVTEDLLNDGPVSDITVLDSLRDALSTKVRKEVITLKVPGRQDAGKAVSLQFDPNIEFEQYQAWANRASKGQNGKPRTDGVDFLRMGMAVISHTNTGVLINGRLATSKNGDAFTVRSSEIHEMLGSPIGGVAMAIRTLFGADSDVIKTMRRIVEAAGYTLDGDDDTSEDENDPLAI